MNRGNLKSFRPMLEASSIGAGPIQQGDVDMRSMMTKVVIVLSISIPVRAADWFRLGDSQFSARVPVTIENPAEVDNPAVLVTCDVSELGEIMPEATARTIAVADDAHQ